MVQLCQYDHLQGLSSFFFIRLKYEVRMELILKVQGRTANSQAHVVRKHGNDSVIYRLLL